MTSLMISGFLEVHTVASTTLPISVPMLIGVITWLAPLMWAGAAMIVLRSSLIS